MNGLLILYIECEECAKFDLAFKNDKFIQKFRKNTVMKVVLLLGKHF